MPDQLDPNKYHIMSKKMKKILIPVAIIFFLFIVPIISYFYYQQAIKRPSQAYKELTFEIKKGQSIIDIAKNLSDKEAINSSFLFVAYIYANRFDDSIQAGVYKLPQGLNIKEIVALFKHGTVDTSVTFIEGWRIEEFARRAAQLFSNVTYEDFMTEAKGLEGYLFPDTYIFSNVVTTSQMVSYLQQIFNTKTANVLTEPALKKAGLTKEQAVIFASIVERETKNDESRPVVAGILIKRWEEGMKLDADATVQYIAAPLRYGCKMDSADICPTAKVAGNLNWWPNDLTKAELSIDSPYNTRRNIGLPTTPIANPSLSALEAVVNYKPSDYYFYIHGYDGQTYYGRTLKEHEDNVRRYLTN